MRFQLCLIVFGLIPTIFCYPAFETSEDAVKEEGLVSDLNLNGQPEDNHVLQFSMFGKKHSLKLKLANSIFAPGFRTNRGSKSAVIDSLEDDVKGNFYTDEEGLGSYYIENIDGQLRVDGVVDDHLRIFHEDGIHKSFRVNKKYPKDTFAYDAVSYESTRNIHSVKESTEPLPPLPDTVTVEVYTLVDKALNDVLQKQQMPVKKYLGVMWNFVQNKYKSTSKPRIEFAITGNTVFDEEEEFITRVIVEDNLLQSTNLLVSFGIWLYSERNEPTTPNFDIAILHTGMDLASPVDNSTTGEVSKNNLGVALLGGVCVINPEMEFQRNVGAMEDLNPSMEFQNIIVVAHEVAHLFGVQHDNEQPKEKHCPANYMMYWEIGPDTVQKFSECSLAFMREHLSKESSSCIRNAPGEPEIPLIPEGNLIESNHFARVKNLKVNEEGDTIPIDAVDVTIPIDAVDVTIPID